ncbi:ATP-binding protein [Streptomyces sp. NPDC006476]|uniref:ATP-binding protein n=1 Tax=Streptomyces sp. NPDC006476 TaxID=3157175 RepID=UPI0033A3BC38
MAAELACPEPQSPELIVLIGVSGAGKTTLAGTWPPTRVVSLDQLRGVMSDDCGDQSATVDAVDALHLIVDRRLARGLTTVVDATSVYAKDRAQLLDAARRHCMPAVAVVVDTPLPVCIERQKNRPTSRRVPEVTVTAQHQAMREALPRLESEGFTRVVIVTADPLACA